MSIQRIGLCAVILVNGLSVLTGAQSPQATTDEYTPRSIKAIGYQVGSGKTTVDLKPAGVIPGARGEARVEIKATITSVEAKMEGLGQATQFGAEFLTYVMWVVSPEGRAINLGEARTNDKGRAELRATTQLQSFSLFVTAEPYAAVREPSEILVLENDTRRDTKGRLFVVENYRLLRRSQYARLSNPLALTPDLKNVPLDMYQARNAVEIARARGADKYAPEIFSKAVGGLELAENALTRKASRTEIVSLARQTAQSSEDARALTAERREQERVENERAMPATKPSPHPAPKAAAEAAAARRRADEEAQRQAELAAAREAQLKAEAAAQEALLKAEAAERRAEAERQQALARSEVERREAALAEAERARKAAEDLRKQLFDQFNRILETRDTERGLVITMTDVLFDVGQYDLRPNTREALARLSGVLLAHSGLNLDIEGHTDSTGAADFNQTLSERRAATVRDYMVQQGLAANSITAGGFGSNRPIGDNATAAGRQQNRRVEIVVSGDVIGVSLGR